LRRAIPQRDAIAMGGGHWENSRCFDKRIMDEFNMH
jgi:hypothetical protein